MNCAACTAVAGPGQFVIRYPADAVYCLDWKCPLEEIPVSKAQTEEGKDLAVITLGPRRATWRIAIERAEKDKESP